MGEFTRLYAYKDPIVETELRVHMHSRGYVQLTIEGRETVAVRMRGHDLDDLIRALKIARENLPEEPADA